MEDKFNIKKNKNQGQFRKKQYDLSEQNSVQTKSMYKAKQQHNEKISYSKKQLSHEDEEEVERQMEEEYHQKFTIHQASDNYRNYHEQEQNQTVNFNYYQSRGRGNGTQGNKGRGRGGQQYPESFASRGRGRGRGGVGRGSRGQKDSQYQEHRQGFAAFPVEFEETQVSSRKQGHNQRMDMKSQSQYQKKRERSEDEDSENFNEAFSEEEDKYEDQEERKQQRSEQKGQGSPSLQKYRSIQESELLQQYGYEANKELDLFSERVFQDKQSMTFIRDSGNQDYVIPEFYKGAVYNFYRESNKENIRTKFVAEGVYDKVQYKFQPFQDKREQNQEHFERNRKEERFQKFKEPKYESNDKDSDQVINEQSENQVIEQMDIQKRTFGRRNKYALKEKQTERNKEQFQRDDNVDFKAQKQIGNKFWNKEEKDAKNHFKQQRGEQQNRDSNGIKQQRKFGHGRGGAIYKDQQRRGGKQGEKSKSYNDKGAGRGGRNQRMNGQQHQRSQRKCFDDHIENEKEIQEGLQSGKYFEGIIRVNPNNRRRAFVNVNAFNVDVMIDSLNLQNRALDGDTVLIQLYPPSKWAVYQSNNIVVGKPQSSLQMKSKEGETSNDLEEEGEVESDENAPSSSLKNLEKKLFQGYSNETAVEMRVVDQNISEKEEAKATGLQSIEEHQQRELKAIKKELSRNKEKEKLQDQDNQSQGNEEEQKEMESPEDQEDSIMDDKNCLIDDEQEESENSANQENQKKQQRFLDIDAYLKEVDKEEENIKKEVPIRFAQIKGTKEEKIQQINEISKSLRPIGEVVAIRTSPHREKELLVTLKAVDNEVLEENALLELIQDNERRKKKKEQSYISEICAIPVSQKLPWMTISSIPREFIEDVKSQKKAHQRYYIVKIIHWNVDQIRPTCQIIKSIGEAGNLEAESLRILKTLDIYSEEYDAGQTNIVNDKLDESLKIFTKDISSETGEWQIPEEEIKKRLDLRKRRIFTIDPITAKDLDDALSIEKISGSIYEIGVHIADVSYFVQQGTELDKEAQLRCTSVYFVHKVYPMLPRLLCERLCSLNPSVDRLAYSVFFKMDARNGEIVDYEHIVPQEDTKSAYQQQKKIQVKQSYRIERTVIRSCAKWHYQLVQDILDGKINSENDLPQNMKPQGGHNFEDLKKDCFMMNEIAQKRRKKRLDNGSVMLQNREFVFLLDESTRMPLSFQESYRISSKFLVEEYMLLANIIVAEHLYKYCFDKTLLRVHPDVDKQKKESLSEFYEKVGLGGGIIDLTNSKTLSLSLEHLKEMCEEEQREGKGGNLAKFNVALRKFLTCLQPAKYICINDSNPDSYLHYGLNFPLYTHFTSPIRRYADLLVHRLITLSLAHKEQTRDLIEQMDYSNYAEMCSEKSLNAKKASTQCTRLFHCLMLKSQGKRVFETLLFDMDQTSIQIFIDEVNMHYKLKLRDDPRIDALVYFKEQMVMVVHLKSQHSIAAADDEDFDKEQSQSEEEEKISTNERKSNLKKKNYKSQTERKGKEKNTQAKRGEEGGNQKQLMEKFKKIQSLKEVKEQFKGNEYFIFSIFDKVKVLVDTTTEFPLDIKCTLLFTEDDMKVYDKYQEEEKQRNEEKQQQMEKKKKENVGLEIFDSNNGEDL